MRPKEAVSSGLLKFPFFGQKGLKFLVRVSIVEDGGGRTKNFVRNRRQDVFQRAGENAADVKRGQGRAITYAVADVGVLAVPARNGRVRNIIISKVRIDGVQ